MKFVIIKTVSGSWEQCISHKMGKEALSEWVLMTSHRHVELQSVIFYFHLLQEMMQIKSDLRSTDILDPVRTLLRIMD